MMVQRAFGSLEGILQMLVWQRLKLIFPTPLRPCLAGVLLFSIKSIVSPTIA